MIRSYKYLDNAVQLKLHEIIIDFFNRIEFERGPFSDAFFGFALGLLAKRHREIIRSRCIEIYNEIKDWDLKRRTPLFNAIRESNNIEQICLGQLEPKKIENTATGVEKLLRDFFIDLYEQVLNGAPFNEQYSTNLREHFDAFSKLNGDITLCPLCGIGELKKHTDDIRDQYDHYLPKASYPFSSVNFKNLVPVCRECNSPEVKGQKDIIAYSSSNRLFFLFDAGHRGVTITFELTREDASFDNCEWNIAFTNPDNKNDEIKSWDNIYDITSRYKGFVNGRIKKWVGHHWSFMHDGRIAHLAAEDRQTNYDIFLEMDEEYMLNFIRRPALQGYFEGSVLEEAERQARLYS